VDFSLSEDQLALRESVRRFAQQELPEIERGDEPVGLELRGAMPSWVISG